MYLAHHQGFVLILNTEGDDVFYGQALFPVPAEDPNDPLQVCPHTTNGTISAKNAAVARLEEDHDPRCLLCLLVPG